MASVSLLSFHLLPPSKFSSPLRQFPSNSLSMPLIPCFNILPPKPLTTIAFALTDSPKPLDFDAQTLLQELSDAFVLPADYFQQLPRDLRLDLNDAAFDLSNGPVKDECGEDLGQILLNITRAWELGDTSTSANLMGKLPLLADSLTTTSKAALGKRLVSASRRFQSMGQYSQGELQQIATVMNRTGKLLSASQASQVAFDEPKQETRVLKFGELQVELSPEKAYVGAGIGFVFGILSWQSLRGALLALFYSSTVLSAFAAGGLILLAGQLKSKDK